MAMNFEDAFFENYMGTMYPMEQEITPPAPVANTNAAPTTDIGGIAEIPRNKAQEALGYVGQLLTKAGVNLDEYGLDIPVLGRVTLKDLTVGESGRILEDMSYGFMPVTGGGLATKLNPEVIDLLGVPGVGVAAKAVAKPLVKATNKLAKALPKDIPVGMGIKPVDESLDPLGFYSAASKAVDNIQQPKGTGAQFLAQIEKTPGVKKEELLWTGLDEFLAGKKSVTKAEVQDYLKTNRVEVKEVQLGSVDEGRLQAFLDDEAGQGFSRSEAMDYLSQDENATKFSKYTLPGGENYREVLLTLPTKIVSEDEARVILNAQPDAKLSEADIAYASRKNANEFTSSHFDQPNVLAHMRLNDRVDADGKKVLFVEEVQSDWHQAGRKKGYVPADEQKAKAEIQKRMNDLDAERKPLNDRINLLQGAFNKDAYADEIAELQNKLNNIQREYAPLANQLSTGLAGVPDAPFKTSWHELSLKRAIQLASEGGYDRIAFTTGKTQAERYDLSKQIGQINARPTPDGKISLEALTPDMSEQVIADVVNANQLDDIVGKEIADKIRTQIEYPKNFDDPGKSVELSGLDLKVGGEGMKGFYDTILPKYLDKYGKKWDAKTGMTKIRLASDAQDAADSKLLKDLGMDEGGQAAASVHYMDITPKMKESVLTKGQPLFQMAPAIPAGAAATQMQEENK